MSQLYYDNDITSRSKLYAIWDDGDDDSDETLAGICDCSPATVHTYRVDYRRRRRKEVTQITWDDLPLLTIGGLVVWTLPIQSGNVSCNKDCPLWEACKYWVRSGGFVGCERPLRKELDCD